MNKVVALFGVLLLMLFVWSSSVPAQLTRSAIGPCTITRTNLQGTPAGTAITVSSTAIRVVGANANKGRCYVVIQNTSANTMHCMAEPQGTPTTTTGMPIPGGQQVRLDYEGQEAYACIRSTGSDATAVVIEGLP